MKKILLILVIMQVLLSCFNNQEKQSSKAENKESSNDKILVINSNISGTDVNILNKDDKKQVTLNGKTTTYKDIIAIADGSVTVLDEKAVKRVEDSYNTLIKAASTGHKIYGLTVGVGLNKDKAMVDASGSLTKEVINASMEFNKGLIHAHCGGYGQYLDERTTRAIMAVRLNNMLFGGSGVSKDVVYMLQVMLNNNILPLIPSKGSIGMADITVLGHLGLAVMGEGDVLYHGKRTPAKDVFAKLNIKPVKLFGKDALSILSSNAQSVAYTVIVLNNTEQLLKASKIIYALSLEALNGNVLPFSENANNLRPFPYFVKVSKDIRNILNKSYLYNLNDERALQDPLSYRDSVYYISALEQSFDQLVQNINIQLNSSDDNPGVLSSNGIGNTQAESLTLVEVGGAVVPTSNFDPVLWTVDLEKLSLSLGLLSTVSTQRTIKLGDEYFTKLTRFLGTDRTVHAFGAMQKPVASLNAENLFLSNPVMLYNTSVAGNIEDIATNAPFAAEKVQKQIDNLFQLYSLELVHAAQAVDLRKASKKDFYLSPVTNKFYVDFRTTVPFLDEDRPLTEDFIRAKEFVVSYQYSF